MYNTKPLDITTSQGRGLPYKKVGVLVGKLRIPKRYQDPVLWAWLEAVLPQRDTNFKTIDYLLSYFFDSVPSKVPQKLPP